MRQEFFMVYTHKNDGRLERFENYQDAEDEAKRKAVFGDAYVLGPIAFVKQPVPNIPVEKL